MTDYAGYRPTDDSALRWEDDHCTKCGERDRSCTCQKPKELSTEDRSAIDRLNAVLDEERSAVVHPLAKPGDWQCHWCDLIWDASWKDCPRCNPPPEMA